MEKVICRAVEITKGSVQASGHTNSSTVRCVQLLECTAGQVLKEVN